MGCLVCAQWPSSNVQLMSKTLSVCWRIGKELSLKAFSRLFLKIKLPAYQYSIYSYQCTTGSVLESKRPVIKGTSAELELSVQFKGTRSHFPNLSAKDCNWSLMPWLRTPEANQRYASSRGNVRYVLRTINGVDQRTYSFLFWLVLCFLQC